MHPPWCILLHSCSKTFVFKRSEIVQSVNSDLQDRVLIVGRHRNTLISHRFWPKRCDSRKGLDWSGSRQGQFEDACELGNEPLGSMRFGNLLTSRRPVIFSGKTLLRGVIDSDFYPVFSPVITGGSLSGVKQSKSEANYSHPRSAEIITTNYLYGCLWQGHRHGQKFAFKCNKTYQCYIFLFIEI
jgi:hypothetical protein